VKQPPSRLPEHAFLLYRDAWGFSHHVAFDKMNILERDDPVDCIVSFKAGAETEVTLRGQKAYDVIEMIRAYMDAPDGGPIPLMPIHL
jgi:hypothetical protein